MQFTQSPRDTSTSRCGNNAKVNPTHMMMKSDLTNQFTFIQFTASFFLPVYVCHCHEYEDEDDNRFSDHTYFLRSPMTISSTVSVEFTALLYWRVHGCPPPWVASSLQQKEEVSRPFFSLGLSLFFPPAQCNMHFSFFFCALVLAERRLPHRCPLQLF